MSYDWVKIKVLYEMGQTAYQIAKGPGMPSKQGIDKRAKREGWVRQEHEGKLPIVAEAFNIDSSRLTDEVLNTVLNLMAEGATQELACAAAGISDETWRTWGKKDPLLKDYTIRARAGKVIGWLSNIDQAGKKDWRASAWQLQNQPDTRNAFGQQHHDNRLEVIISIDRGDVIIDAEALPERP